MIRFVSFFFLVQLISRQFRDDGCELVSVFLKYSIPFMYSVHDSVEWQVHAEVSQRKSLMEYDKFWKTRGVVRKVKPVT